MLLLSLEGIERLTAMGDLGEAIFKYDRHAAHGDFDEEEARKSVDAAHARAEFARNERDKGFPVLHGHSAVALWGTLEAATEDLAVLFLKNDPALLDSHAFSKIRIPLVKYGAMNEDERLQLLVAEHRKNEGATFKTGVGRFETVLDAISMGGGVDDDTRKALLELQQVRNVLVHRAGIADARLVQLCPWLGLSVGDRVAVTHEAYVKYRTAVTGYVLELMRRGLVYRGLSREEAEKKVPMERDPSEAEG